MLIYRAAGAASSSGAAARALTGHRAVQAEAAARGELHAVARLDGIERAKTVAVRANAHVVSDGPYIEAKEWLVGFYLVDCASEAEALERARTLCPDDSHAIEVRPVSWRWRGDVD